MKRGFKFGVGRYKKIRGKFPKITSETVEKVPKQILGGDAEKNDFTECTTINDLTIMKGRETPKNQALTILKGFSTASPEVLRSV